MGEQYPHQDLRIIIQRKGGPAGSLEPIAAPFEEVPETFVDEVAPEATTEDSHITKGEE